MVRAGFRHHVCQWRELWGGLMIGTRREMYSRVLYSTKKVEKPGSHMPHQQQVRHRVINQALIQT